MGGGGRERGEGSEGVRDEGGSIERARVREGLIRTTLARYRKSLLNRGRGS